MYENTVIIVGAGPTGLTLAIDLARRGVPIRLVEAATEPFAGSRGKGIQPRTLEVFDDLGVVDAILASGATYPKFRVHLGPFSVRAGSLGSSKRATEHVPYPNLWMTPQARTEAILRGRLGELGGTVEFGCALTAFTQDSQGVQATLATGESVRGAYLVGADGGHSAVRKILGLKLAGQAVRGEDAVDEAALVADVEVDGLDTRDWHIWPLAKGGPFGLCPLPNTQLFQLSAKATTVADGIEGAVRQATGLRVGRVGWQSTYRPAARMVDRYRVGRVFLAGDAAHVHPPAGGQGLNTGVQDAYNLGWKLAWAATGGPDSVLDTYEAERLPVAAAVLGLTKRLHQTRSLKRGDVTNQLGVQYRASPLSSGGAFGELLPGDRMPDARLNDGSRLFDYLRGPHATQILTTSGVRILVRPDGYIAKIGADECSTYGGLPARQVLLERSCLSGAAE